MLAPSAATRAAFAAWHDASADHADAYARIDAAQAQAQAIADEAPLLALRHETLARTMLARRPSGVRPRAVAAALLFLAGAPLAALGLHYWTPGPVAAPAGEIFHTGIGQQADVTLPDGSTVTLDTASRIEVRYTETERRVRLDGQGWFQLKPSGKPFVLTAGGHDFSADAGDFDVRTDAGRVRAFAGRGVIAMSGGASSVALAPGRLLSARGSDVTIRRLDNPATVIGWRDGLLQFEDVPLAEAAGELNRYRRRPIRIADARAAALRVSGSFHADENAAFVDALTTGFPVRVVRDNHEGIVIGSR